MKKVIGALLSFAIVFTMMLNIGVTDASAATNKNAYNVAPFALEDVDGRYFGFERIAESDGIALYVNNETVNFAVLNKKSGKIWSALLPRPQLAEDGYINADGTYSDVFTSLIITNHIDSRSVTLGYVAKHYSAWEFIDQIDYDKIANEGSFHSIDYSKVENGFRLLYDSHRASTNVTLDIALDASDDTLIVVLENTDTDSTETDGFKGGSIINTYNSTVSVTLFPYFGASKDTDEGYIFYPDGSGTIAEYTTNHTSAEGENHVMVYAPSSRNEPNTEVIATQEAMGIMPMLYPVYGIKNGDDAMFTVITDGAEHCSVTHAPAGAQSNYNRIYPSLFFKPLLHLQRGSHATSYTVRSYYEYTYIAFKYYFLDGDDADYAGMANKYREHLFKNDMMNDAIADTDSIPLAVDFFMNTYIEGIFGNTSVVMTTFDQIRDMVSELNEDGIKDMLINISAWQKNGIAYEEVIPVYSKLGGLNDLEKLTALTKELGYDLFMEVNVVEANDNTTKFRSARDAALDLEGLALTVIIGGVGTGRGGFGRSAMGYMVAPPTILQRYTDIYYDYFKNSGISGFNYQKLGYVLYTYNYDDEFNYRTTTKEIMTSALERSKKDFGKNAVWYGNDYALKYSDWIYDLPMIDTGYSSTTREVPFAQILLHGYIPYSGMAGNMFYDETQQTLKWIEYGYIPYYKLTSEKTSNLLGTAMDSMFSTEYSVWHDNILEKYQMFDSEFGDIYTATIVEHEKLADNVFMTEYSNGTKVYVNYGEFDYRTSDGVVGAENYLVAKG